VGLLAIESFFCIPCHGSGKLRAASLSGLIFGGGTVCFSGFIKYRLNFSFFCSLVGHLSFSVFDQALKGSVQFPSQVKNKIIAE